jgi:hypothetical protein
VLKSTVDEANSEPHRPGRVERLWHDPARNTPGLGCARCRERDLCGGLVIKAAFLDCLQFCCGKSQNCDRVCRNNPDYVDRLREVGTFDLNTVPRGPVLDAPALPPILPIIFHGNGRDVPIRADAVALPLYRMFNRRTGAPRFADGTAMRSQFGIAPETAVLLTGTDRDPPLERWWGLGETARRSIIRSLKNAGVVITTTPNYSLFLDRPRWDDLHSMKRIAIVHSEFLSEGLPAALHVNGRTDADFRRCTNYVLMRPEITHLAYEFTTGTGAAGRREKHASWLVELARSVPRPLHLMIRGGAELRRSLNTTFANVTFLDTSVFMKTATVPVVWTAFGEE